jgi:hypothetical protein
MITDITTVAPRIVTLCTTIDDSYIPDRYDTSKSLNTAYGAKDQVVLGIS